MTKSIYIKIIKYNGFFSYGSGMNAKITSKHTIYCADGNKMLSSQCKNKSIVLFLLWDIIFPIIGSFFSPCPLTKIIIFERERKLSERHYCRNDNWKCVFLLSYRRDNIINCLLRKSYVSSSNLTLKPATHVRQRLGKSIADRSRCRSDRTDSCAVWSSIVEVFKCVPGRNNRTPQQRRITYLGYILQSRFLHGRTSWTYRV